MNLAYLVGNSALRIAAIGWDDAEATSATVADMRAMLKGYADKLYTQDGMVAHAANEIEGFLFRGGDAERTYHETGRFEFISTGGYYHSLPGDALRQFIDTAAEVQRAQTAAQSELESANEQVNAVRAELEGELTRMRAALEQTRRGAD